MTISLVTTSLSTQIKVEAIPLSALPKDTTSESTAYLHTIPFLCWTSNTKAVNMGVGSRGP